MPTQDALPTERAATRKRRQEAGEPQAPAEEVLPTQEAVLTQEVLPTLEARARRRGGDERFSAGGASEALRSGRTRVTSEKEAEEPQAPAEEALR